MKRNEYRRVRTRNEIQFHKGSKEILWEFNEPGLSCYFNADLRWFNFNGFDLGDVKIGNEGFIIGD